MKDEHIALIPLNHIKSDLLKYITLELERVFSYKTVIYSKSEVNVDMSQFYNNESYNSSLLLDYVEDSNKLPINAIKILLITEYDLYSPIFSKMFGEAQLNGRLAIVSFFRLKQTENDQKVQQELFFSRCIKEAIHEIGHTFGLTHCANVNCTLYPSSKVIDTDIKSSTLCTVCQANLKECLKG